MALVVRVAAPKPEGPCAVGPDANAGSPVASPPHDLALFLVIERLRAERTSQSTGTRARPGWHSPPLGVFITSRHVTPCSRRSRVCSAAARERSASTIVRTPVTISPAPTAQAGPGISLKSTAA